MMRRLVLLVVLATSTVTTGCVSTGDSARAQADKSPENRGIPPLLQQTQRNDSVGVRAQLASAYLSLAGWPGAARSDRLDNAQRALEHADQAIVLDADRVEGHYYRAVSIGRMLDAQLVPNMGLVGDLEAAGVRARELDPAFDMAGPLRLLALLYWQAPPWPMGPESAKDHEVIDALFREALALAWGSVENHLCYAEYLADQERREPAAEHLRMAHDLVGADRSIPEREKPDLRRRIDALADDLLGGKDPRQGPRPARFRRTDEAQPTQPRGD